MADVREVATDAIRRFSLNLREKGVLLADEGDLVEWDDDRVSRAAFDAVDQAVDASPDDSEKRIALLTAATGVVQAYDSDDLQKMADAVDRLQDVLEGGSSEG